MDGIVLGIGIFSLFISITSFGIMFAHAKGKRLRNRYMLREHNIFEN